MTDGPRMVTCYFVSRYCRECQHKNCAGAWVGLELEIQVICTCDCHKEVELVS